MPAKANNLPGQSSRLEIMAHELEKAVAAIGILAQLMRMEVAG